MSIKSGFCKAIVLTIFLFSVTSLHAKVKLPSILGDNMVLQQKTAAKLWGWAKENVKIKITTSWDKVQSVQNKKGILQCSICPADR